MLDISDANKAAVGQEVPWPVDLVELIVDPENENGIIRLTNHFHDITTRGIHDPNNDVTFTAASQFLGFGNITDNLEVKDNSLDISLSGVGQELTSIVLNNPVEGSRIYVLRAFYDENSGDIADTPYQRWAGRVNSYNIQDDYRFSDQDKIIISLQCKSLLITLLERVAGRYTNKASFENKNPNDLSMEFVASLVNFAPFFGKGADVPQPPPPPPPPSGKHLCTRYWELGDISDDVFEADNAYRTQVDDKLYNWYSSWAESMAEDIEKGTVKYYIVKPFVRAWSNSMAYKMGTIDKRSYFGEFLEWLGYKLSR